MAHGDSTQSSGYDYSQPSKYKSTTTPPIRSLADLVLDPTAFSSILANASPNSISSTVSTASQKDNPSPTSTANTIHSAPNPESTSAPMHRPSIGTGTSLADLVLNNVTYDAILASSARKLGLEPDEERDVEMHAPPNSPVGVDGYAYGSLVGVTQAIMEGDERK